MESDGEAGVTRRQALKLLAGAGVAAATGCSAPPSPRTAGKPASQQTAPAEVAAARDVEPILGTAALGFQWRTRDPFLFCVHHDDRYPAGNARLGPAVSLEGRDLGSDFEPKDGFRMYHGRVVPGFPRHPHRGFETVTVVRRGLLDHSDSMGAAARYGGGDVQWLTAGSGIQHAEMFPLLDRERENPLELFQIWLNLPARRKLVSPHFSMLWRDTIPVRRVRDDAGRDTTVTVMAGRYDDATAPSPPPDSWASQPDSDLAIWTIKQAPGASFALPAARPGSDRSLYVFRGEGLRVSGREVRAPIQVDLRADLPIRLDNGAAESEALLLQGRPIGEPVARHGPFVMNTADEIRQAYADYRSTQFGGWSWHEDDPVHGHEPARFARHADGRTERRG